MKYNNNELFARYMTEVRNKVLAVMYENFNEDIDELNRQYDIWLKKQQPLKENTIKRIVYAQNKKKDALELHLNALKDAVKDILESFIGPY